MSSANPLGRYMRDRRERLDPVALGFPPARRRTAGLRREEVAQRAEISPTWYTWLEQGRGGAPSAEVLERIAGALMLTDIEREHLFLVGLGRPPAVRAHERSNVSPRLQRVLDAFEVSPAIVKTATWDVVAWNRAATVVITDYSKLAPERRNILRILFSDSRVRGMQHDWQAVARFVVGVFRADVVRAGAGEEAERLIDELSQSSPEFAAMWRDQEVCAYGDGVKRLRHTRLGDLSFEYSAFVVDGRPDLGMVVYNPVEEEDARRIRALIEEAAASHPSPPRLEAASTPCSRGTPASAMARRATKVL